MLPLVGSASEYISQSKRIRILEAVDPIWRKFGSDDLSIVKDMLLCTEFLTYLIGKVEKETALAKAVSSTVYGSQGDTLEGMTYKAHHRASHKVR